MTVVWIIVGIVAVVVFGPMLLEMWRTPGEPERRAPPPSPAWAGWLAAGLALVLIVVVVMNYLGYFGLSS